MREAKLPKGFVRNFLMVEILVDSRPIFRIPSSGKQVPPVTPFFYVGRFNGKSTGKPSCSGEITPILRGMPICSFPFQKNTSTGTVSRFRFSGSAAFSLTGIASFSCEQGEGCEPKGDLLLDLAQLGVSRPPTCPG